MRDFEEESLHTGTGDGNEKHRVEWTLVSKAIKARLVIPRHSPENERRPSRIFSGHSDVDRNLEDWH
jgi:hypothetical protein